MILFLIFLIRSHIFLYGMDGCPLGFATYSRKMISSSTGKTGLSPGCAVLLWRGVFISRVVTSNGRALCRADGCPTALGSVV